MNKNILEFLKNLKLTNNEINTMLEINPLLSSAIDVDVLNNLEMVVDAGYPESDLNVLVYANPLFLTEKKETLENKLDEIVKNGNVEESIKNNFDIL